MITEEKTLYCGNCMTVLEDAFRSCPGCHALNGYSRPTTYTFDAGKRQAFLTMRALRRAYASLPEIDERDERGIGPVHHSAAPVYQYPHIVARNTTSHHRPVSGSSNQVYAYSHWSYHLTCTGCGVTEQSASCSSVSAEDAPAHFGREHKDCI